jgi:hypothetical protein
MRALVFLSVGTSLEPKDTNGPEHEPSGPLYVKSYTPRRAVENADPLSRPSREKPHVKFATLPCRAKLLETASRSAVLDDGP